MNMIYMFCTLVVAMQGRSLIDIINTEHHHPKYLPGVHLGDKVIASTDLEWVRSHHFLSLTRMPCS
jgi:glycerol-3-phosphate dehydrogenase